MEDGKLEEDGEDRAQAGGAVFVLSHGMHQREEPALVQRERCCQFIEEGLAGSYEHIVKTFLRLESEAMAQRPMRAAREATSAREPTTALCDTCGTVGGAGGRRVAECEDSIPCFRHAHLRGLLRQPCKPPIGWLAHPAATGGMRPCMPGGPRRSIEAVWSVRYRIWSKAAQKTACRIRMLSRRASSQNGKGLRR